ncbi:MoxR family ATPase [Dactylosporangium sp. NPDC049742]|uniref:AAA family ATPase n=1 Tax=Dactylosporangium sp. NPDC049742 TaxID=3154737 RepID=UPI003427DB97
MPDFESPAALAAGLADAGYLADEGLAMAGFLALRLHRPIFLEGDAGVGKTAFAAALAETAGVELIRLQCYEGLDASHALYDWDFARQVLHLRALESIGTAAHGTLSAEELEADLYHRRFLLARPLLRAIERAPCVLLVDEVDRADDEFEAYLLEVLADAAVTVPELGTITAEVPPVVVVTSNRTREVHDALKRRCLYHWVGHPTPERETAILRRRLPGLDERLAAQVAAATAHLRTLDLVKPPGVAEAIDWAAALRALAADTLTAGLADATLGVVLKVREDIELAAGTVGAR